jgi:hypothetical protein
MRTILAIIFMTFATQASTECGDMCDRTFWLNATIADVKRAIDKGEDINQRDSQHCTILLNQFSISVSSRVCL